MITQQQRLAIIARVYQEWAAEQSVKPDPTYATSGDSQYPEGIEALSAPADAQADLFLRTNAALEAASAEQALALAIAYTEANSPYARVTHLLEDATDYYAQRELIDPNDPRGELVPGLGCLFIKKATGRVWETPYVYVIDKIDGMHEVQ